ncbi:DUF6803 family protein [Megasphaera vaginalis (ex Bordigoni et al. 2020)]|uniref:DUF6803 family protein n=1 Tax=Megasphaera vaginalis (ex Bordigoni et al. 2020) TaxID=2045301 RepID=UPI00190EB8CA|nr:DUF6803 family protein [Megasphaera vaginalis (ex Bordigoni et al. 2020)]
MMMNMAMTHYMELLSLHQPWFLILFMLVPMTLAETVLASEIFSLYYQEEGKGTWSSLRHGASIVLAIFFIAVAIFIAVWYVPTIQWRGPLDVIAVYSYLLAVIPAVVILLMEFNLISKNSDTRMKLKKHVIWVFAFVALTHIAMVFGMADPQLAGWTAPQQSMPGGQMMNHDGMSNDMMNHGGMSHDTMNHGDMHQHMMNQQQSMNMNQGGQGGMNGNNADSCPMNQADQDQNQHKNS